MSELIIKRYFSEDIFQKIKSDFKFLIDKIIQSGFEYDLQIRNNYFNLYYKGNSIGKISYDKMQQLYKVKINRKFINEKIKEQFNPKEEKYYFIFSLSKKQLHLLFKSQNLSSMEQKVKEVNFQEEIAFEQMLMTDNINRTDLIIIDRQVMDKSDEKTKMDLLVLKQKNNNDYQFCVIEVKLGNNPELRIKVISQLNGYVNRITNYFEDYKKCYELNFKQKQELGLIDKNLNINIVPDVLGVVVVGGYCRIAQKSIVELKEKCPTIKVLHLKNEIDLSKAI